jgi:hypothetical protein
MLAEEPDEDTEFIVDFLLIFDPLSLSPLESLQPSALNNQPKIKPINAAINKQTIICVIK